MADRRQPTPSAAAESATPDGETIQRQIEGLGETLRSRTAASISRMRSQVDSVRRELNAHEPGRRIQTWMQSLDYLGEKLNAIVTVRLAERRAIVRETERSLAAIQPEREIRSGREGLERLVRRIDELAGRSVEERRRRLERAGGLLHSLSPDATVKRGFSITLDKEGNPLTSVASVKSGDHLRTRLSDGEVTSIVEKA